jgi:putative membrane protein
MAIASQSTLSDSNKLAVERTRLAHERTLMAWVRTSTSLISFGFSIYKFFQYLRESGQVAAYSSLIGPRGFGLIMITIGVVTLVLATIEHRREVHALRDQYGLLVPRSLATYTAGLIATLGVLLLLAALFRQ